MQTTYITYPHSLLRDDLPETIAAIGFFDGIHLGHQAVIKEAVQQARKANKSSAVISFYPHPSVVLKQSTESIAYLTPIEEKQSLLRDLGVDRFYIITFNKELSLLSPQVFIDHFIIGLHIEQLIAGFDFTFGHKGAGNMTNIKTFSQGQFDIRKVGKVSMEEQKISSTNIRKSLETGNLDKVYQDLGRYYQAKGIVVKGDQRGRELGFPTANLAIDEEKLLPKQGVYAVQVQVGARMYQGMASLGLNPTFKEHQEKPQVEVHIFDFDQFIYGEELIILWHQFIRKEEKYSGRKEIIQQLQIDEKEVRHYFNRSENKKSL